MTICVHRRTLAALFDVAYGAVSGAVGSALIREVDGIADESEAFDAGVAFLREQGIKVEVRP